MNAMLFYFILSHCGKMTHCEKMIQRTHYSSKGNYLRKGHVSLISEMFCSDAGNATLMPCSSYRGTWYSQSHLRWLFWRALSKLKAQSSNLSFHWNVARETFELWALRVDLNPSKLKSTRFWDRNMRIDFRPFFLVWYKIPVWFVFRTC